MSGKQIDVVENGVGRQEKIKKTVDEYDSGTESLMTFMDKASFYATRVAVPLGTNKNRRKQMAGINFGLFQKWLQDAERLDESRAKEWKNGTHSTRRSIY